MGVKRRNKRISLLDQAVKRDPKFVLAYCALAKAYDELYQAKDITPVEKRDVDYRALAEAPWKRRGGFSPTLAPCISRSLTISFGRTMIFRRPVLEIDLARRTHAKQCRT